MIRPIALGAALLGATQAAALSCAAPDAADSYRMASQSPDRYLILYGTFDADPSRFPDTAGTDPDPSAEPVEATFAGHALRPEGFTELVDGPVTLRPSCVGPWCGGYPGEGPVLAFARILGSGYEVELDPCGTWTFPDPSPETLNLMAACLRGETCETPGG